MLMRLATILLGVTLMAYGDRQSDILEFEILQRAALRGSISAQHSLGNRYHNGQGVEKDFVEAA